MQSLPGISELFPFYATSHDCQFTSPKSHTYLQADPISTIDDKQLKTLCLKAFERM